MPWITTKSGKHINTDWFDDDEKRKQQQIESNKRAVAAYINGIEKIPVVIVGKRRKS